MQHRLTGFGLLAMQQIQKMSIIAKVIFGVTLVFYFLSFIPGVEDNLAVIPAYFGPPNMKIWTLLTGIFYESSIILVVLDLVAIIGFTTFLEPLWGPKEFLIFSGVVGVASMVSGIMATVLCYAVTRSYPLLLSPYHGMVALVCGYIVAVKQLHPDSVPLPPPAPPTIRVKHLPGLLVVASLFLALLHLVSYPFFWLVLSGSGSSWIYLRFYQKKEQDSRGDMSEGFAFATFFPEPIQPPLARLGGFIFHILVLIKVCPKTVRTYDVGSSSTVKLTLPGTDPLDAQRRKQRALKALDERLNKSSEPLSWPSLDEPGNQEEQATTTSAGSQQLEAVVVVDDTPVTATPPPPNPEQP